MKCQKLLKAGKLNNQVCFSLLDKIVDSTAMGAAERVLMYDTRKYVARTSSFPPGHEPLERYLNRPDVKSAIHASKLPHKFEECANPPFNALSHQDGMLSCAQPYLYSYLIILFKLLFILDLCRQRNN